MQIKDQSQATMNVYEVLTQTSLTQTSLRDLLKTPIDLDAKLKAQHLLDLEWEITQAISDFRSKEHERMVFYVDLGKLPPEKAKEYLGLIKTKLETSKCQL